MRKKNELNLLQNEVLTLESELRELEMIDEQMNKEDREETYRRRLPDIPSGRSDHVTRQDIPSGRRDHVTMHEPPELHRYDESSIGRTNEQFRGNAENTMYDFKFEPQTSTPFASEPKQQDGASTALSKTQEKSGTKVKPATYDGTGHWKDYKAHFDACAELNKWTEKEKGLYLAVSLRGQAQGVFGNLADRSNDFNELTKALEERFAPPNQTELYRVQMKERRQRASESLTELGQDIWRLTNLAYPTAPSDVRETLAKE